MTRVVAEPLSGKQAEYRELSEFCTGLGEFCDKLGEQIIG